MTKICQLVESHTLKGYSVNPYVIHFYLGVFLKHCGDFLIMGFYYKNVTVSK